MLFTQILGKIIIAGFWLSMSGINRFSLYPVSCKTGHFVKPLYQKEAIQNQNSLKIIGHQSDFDFLLSVYSKTFQVGIVTKLNQCVLTAS